MGSGDETQLQDLHEFYLGVTFAKWSHCVLAPAKAPMK